MTVSNLLFRRQFLITPDTCASLGHWQHLYFGQYNLYAHPDLEISTATTTDTNVTVTLLGYIIDPNFPDRSNADILSTILNLTDSVERISDYLSTVSGRFVLIISTATETFLFHDPCGLRSVYYTKYNGQVFVGSQPLIIKQILPLKYGERFFSYFQSSYPKINIEHWLPSGCSLLEEVQHLVPNHYLCFSTVEQIRYWPKKPLPKKRVNEIVTEAADLLKRLMIAANNRFELALPLTAGLDSRILLGASKSISSEIYFYTLQYRNLDSSSNDIKIPVALLKDLGLNHNLIDCRRPVTEEFRDIYEQNALPAHMDDWGIIACGMLDTYPQDRVCVKGNCSEIARCYYYKNGTHRPITSSDQIVALEEGWHKIPFVRDYMSTWYDRAIEAATEANIDILDLLYWEHRMGSWQAQSQLEWDIVQEAYTPFNHRGLLELLLSVPAELRSAPNYLVYKMMLEVLWPEVMRYRVNPTTTKQRVKNILNYIGIYEGARRVYKQILKNSA